MTKIHLILLLKINGHKIELNERTNERRYSEERVEREIIKTIDDEWQLF